MVLPDALIARVKELLSQNVPVAQIIAEAKQQGHQISSSTIYKIRQTFTMQVNSQTTQQHRVSQSSAHQPVLSVKNMEAPQQIIDNEKVIKLADARGAQQMASQPVILGNLSQIKQIGLLGQFGQQNQLNPPGSVVQSDSGNLTGQVNQLAQQMQANANASASANLAQSSPAFAFQPPLGQPLAFDGSEKLGVAAEITRTKILAKLICGVSVKAARQWDLQPGDIALEFDKFVGFLRQNQVQCCVIASTQFEADENLCFDEEVIPVRRVVGAGLQLFLKHEVEVVCLKYFSIFKRKIIYIHFAQDYVRACLQDSQSSQVIHLEHFQVRRHPDDARRPQFCCFHAECLENLCTCKAVSRFGDYQYTAYYIAQLLYALYLLSPQTLFVVGGELFEQSAAETAQNQLQNADAASDYYYNQTPFTNSLLSNKQSPRNQSLRQQICEQFARLYANFGPNLNLETFIYQADADSTIQGALHMVVKELKESNLVTPCDFLQQVTSMSPSVAHVQTPGRMRFAESKNATPTLGSLVQNSQ